MNKPQRISDLEDLISQVSGISVKNILSNSRDREYAMARATVWFAAYAIMGYSSPYLAKLYNRDHTTIIAGVKKIRGSSQAKLITELIIKNIKELAYKETDKVQTSVERWKI